MAGEWSTVSLDQVYEFSSGLSKPSTAFGSGFPFLSFKDVFYNFFVPERLTDLVQSTEQERARCSVKRGDVFLTRTSETVSELGMSCVCLRDVPDATFNGFTKRLRPKPDGEIIPEYAGFFFRSPGFRQAVTAMSSMSTRASLNNEMLARLSITLPPLAEQSAIAHILGALNGKIELNRRMNETLEAIARALFKSWFVDFDPVRAKVEDRDPSLPQHLADLFPNSLENSPAGEVPKGWRVTSLSDFATLNPESWSKKTRPAEIDYVDLSNAKFGRIDTPMRYSKEDAPSRAQRVLRPLDTIVGTVRPGNASYALVSVSGLTGSTGFAVLRPERPASAEFVYLAASAPENIERLAHLADGGAYPAVRPEVVAATPVVNPGAEIQQVFSGITASMLRKVAANEDESRTLAALRDTLLPKLISGELRVNDAERYITTAR